MARLVFGNVNRAVTGAGISGLGFTGVIGHSEAKKLNLTWSFSTCFACLCLFAILAIKVAIQLRCTELSYVLAHQQKRTVAYEMERRELDLQLSILQRSDVLAEQAEQLGLKPLKAEQIRVL